MSAVKRRSMGEPTECLKEGLFLTWTRHEADRGRRIRQDPEHACDAGCLYYTHPRARDLFLCKSSCVIHVCGAGRCDKATAQDRRYASGPGREYALDVPVPRVCPISGLEIDVSLPMVTYADVGRGAGQASRGSVARAGEPAYGPREQRAWEVLAMHHTKPGVAPRDLFSEFVSRCVVYSLRVDCAATPCHFFALAVAYHCKENAGMAAARARYPWINDLRPRDNLHSIKGLTRLMSQLRNKALQDPLLKPERWLLGDFCPTTSK